MSFALEAADGDGFAGEHGHQRRVVAEDLGSDVPSCCSEHQEQTSAWAKKSAHRVSFISIIATVKIAAGDRDHERVQIVSSRIP